MNEGKIKIVVPVVIIAAALLITVYMIKHKIKPKKNEVVEKSILVDVMIAEFTDNIISVKAQGVVTPSEQVQIKAEVSGKITRINKSLVPGGLFKEGDVMAQIDTRDYEVRVAAAEEALASARSYFEQEKARKQVAEEEWSLIEQSPEAESMNKDLALREPQFRQAEAALKAAENALIKARLDLERCTVKAPFNCVVIRENVDTGQYVSPQSEMAVLAGTDEYWVQISVPVDHLSVISLPDNGEHPSMAIITLQIGSETVQWKGRVKNLLGDLDSAGRMARLLISIDDPYGLRKKERQIPLFLGSYVTVDLKGKTQKNVCVIPRKALRDINGVVSGDGVNSGFVYIMNGEDRLQYREVGLGWKDESMVTVTSGLKSGDRIVISSVPTPVQGIKLKKNGIGKHSS